WAFRQWQWEQRKQGFAATRAEKRPRPYPIPSSFQPGTRKNRLKRFDVIYVTDFFRQAKSVDSVLQEIESIITAGCTVGYVHLNSPQTNRRAGIAPKLFELQMDGKLPQVSETDRAEASLLVVYDAAIGMFIDRVTSNIRTQRGIVVVESTARLKGAQEKQATNFIQALRQLDYCFETKFEIVGTSGSVQRKIETIIPRTRVLDDDFLWNTHVPMSAASVSAPKQPSKLGFHTFGNIYRWPSSKEIFSTVYFGDGYQTRFYGQLGPIRKKYGDDV